MLVKWYRSCSTTALENQPLHIVTKSQVKLWTNVKPIKIDKMQLKEMNFCLGRILSRIQ